MKGEILFCGHSAVIVTIAGMKVAIDPWLEENPLCPSELKNPGKLDLIVLTHGHFDHASDVARVAKLSGAKVAATYELAVLAGESGVAQDKLIYMNTGGSVTFGDLKVTLTPALHSSSFDTPKGPAYAGDACGTVLKSSSWTVYHAGDTSLFSDMKLIGERYKPDVALVPIGDNFTMGPEEAALAVSYVGARTAIPLHFKTFPPLTGTPDEFAKACKALEIGCAVLEPGKVFKA